ncbi:MAG: lamin tail domain-containing protein [Candidatus Pacebacteria bacterium]|nr:lamin tail domain-containing protein [Candidatus Paceibacterota bacterium]
MLIGFTFLFIIFISLLFIFAIPVEAKVVINEVYPNPLSGETEWVELFNDSTISANLEGWVLEDKLSSPKVIYSFDVINFLPNQLFLASVSGQLNNSGDGVVLKNDLDETVDQMDYFTSTQGLSWSRQLDSEFILSSPSPLEPHEIILDPSPTPSFPPSPTPVSSPVISPLPSPIIADLRGKLELVKLMSCPENSDEWFELKNTSEDYLQGDLILFDSQNNKFSFELNLPAQQSNRYYLDRHILNNSGDTLTLIQKPDIQLFSYDIALCDEKNLEFVLQNGKLRQNIENNILRSESQINSEQGKILGDSSDVSQTIKIPQSEQLKRFRVPLSYIDKIKFLSSVGDTQYATSEAKVKKKIEDYAEEDSDNRSLHSVILIISGGIILSFLGIMYFYGKDWFKNHLMA